MLIINLTQFRPPLEYIPPIKKGKCKPLTSLLGGNRDYMAMFEDTEPPKPQPIEKHQDKKERLKREKLTKHLVES